MKAKFIEFHCTRCDRSERIEFNGQTPPETCPEGWTEITEGRCEPMHLCPVCWKAFQDFMDASPAPKPEDIPF